MRFQLEEENGNTLKAILNTLYKIYNLGKVSTSRKIYSDEYKSDLIKKFPQFENKKDKELLTEIINHLINNNNELKTIAERDIKNYNLLIILRNWMKKNKHKKLTIVFFFSFIN